MPVLHFSLHYMGYTFWTINLKSKIVIILNEKSILQKQQKKMVVFHLFLYEQKNSVTFVYFAEMVPKTGIEPVTY